MRTKNLAVVCAVAFAVLCLFVTLFNSLALGSSKVVRTSGISGKPNLGLYSDGACTLSLTSIDWGLVYPGASSNRTIYIKNLGNLQLVLNLATTNWNPRTANSQIVVNWNRESAALAASQVVSATLTLSVSSNATNLTAFRVDVVITGLSMKSRV